MHITLQPAKNKAFTITGKNAQSAAAITATFRSHSTKNQVHQQACPGIRLSQQAAKHRQHNTQTTTTTKQHHSNQFTCHHPTQAQNQQAITKAASQ